MLLTKLRKFRMWIPVLSGCFVSLVCVLRSFVPPHTPLLFWGDAMGYATKGERILSGEMPFRNFFDFIPPATELVYASLFRIFGVSLWVPGALMCFLGGLVAWCSTWIAARLVSGWMVLLPGTLIAGFVLWGSLDATHHWFSTVTALLIVVVLFERVSTGRVGFAGALCGVTASFTQSKGAAVFVGLLVYFWWESRREKIKRDGLLARCTLLWVAAFLTFAAINAPYVIASGVHLWIADVLIFPIRYFGAASANNWHAMAQEFPEHRGALKFIVYPFLLAAVPLTYAFAVIRSARAGESAKQRQVMLLAIVGLAMLAVILPSLSIRRLSCASPPAVILLAWLLRAPRAQSQLIAKTLAAVSLLIAVAQIAAIQLHRHYPLTLPAGNVAVLEPGIAEAYAGLAQRTHPGEWFFGLPPMTLPLRLKNPTPIESPSPGEYTRPEQVSAVIAGLEKTRTPLLLLRPVMYTPYALGYKGDHLEPFRAYLMTHYRRTTVFATGDEVWERLGAD